MSAGGDYFHYPHRSPGPDHARYEHRYLEQAAPVAWPGGKRLLVWATVHLEHFPMDMPRTPFLPLGGMERPPPSVWDYSMRDYGNRIGIYRLMKVLDAYGIRATAAMNSVVAERYPVLLGDILKRGWEIAASGVDMGQLHHGQVPRDVESERVERSFATLRRLTGQRVEGWHSPAFSQSSHTPDLVAAQGARWIGDWINDDMPYRFNTSAGPLTQMPISYDMSDRKILFLHNQSAAHYEQQIGAAFDCLHAESATAAGGRILSLSLSPWVIGQPSKIATLDRLLKRFMAGAGVASATGGDILKAWSHAQAGVAKGGA
jgi:allantoinase